MFGLTDEILNEYLASIGKKRAEVSGIRERSVTSREDGIKLEIDIDNGHVQYTRVAYMWIGHGGSVKYKSVTSRTRLHVPASEVPEDAVVYLVNGDGPFSLDGPNDDNMIFAAYVHGEDTYRALLNADDKVSVEFHYVRGVGVFAGTGFMCSDEMIQEWLCSNGKDMDLDAIVNGCKFSLWSLCHKLTTGKDSIFDMP